MLAGILNKRWEALKKEKQEIQNKEKFIDLISSGFSFGDTERDSIKKDITENIQYKFNGPNKKYFHRKEDIFLPENIKYLRRNAFILICTTVILKNQILPPLLRFLEKKYKIKYNRSEKSFISYARKIHAQYTLQKSYFNGYIQYDLPLSLQYDYPFASSTSNQSEEISKNINDFNKMQQAVVGYVNEIDSLLPKSEEFDLPQPAFNAIFIQNLNKVKRIITQYITKRITIDENSSKVRKTHPEKIHAKTELIVSKIIINSFVRELDLMMDPPNVKIFSEGAYQEIEVPVIKINSKTGNLILQTMNLTSYGLFKNELSTLNLGFINYTIDEIYTELDIESRIKSTISYLADEMSVYESFDSVNTFLELKEGELRELQR